ncbi:MAG: Ig-like domain-containing protein [Prevotella sp.]|nr:Ig-like domain-containing protein [Prevotella sp.]
MSARKYYALNNLGEYEECGLYPEVATLKVAGGDATEIEYIKAKDNAYINLNYIPKANSRAVAVIDAETGGDWKAIYGCGYFSGGWRDRFCFFTTNATINLGGETGNREAMRYGEKIVTVLDAALGTMEIYEADGTTHIGTITDSPKTADCKTPLYVFAQNKDVPGGSTFTDCYNMLTKLYSLKLYEGETLVMDLVPVVTADGKGGLKNKLTNTIYTSANSGEFELSADGEAIASEAGISVYEGKLVKLTTDNHEYKYQDGEWLDCGAMSLEEIADTDPSYKDMRNWKTNEGHMSIFEGFTYDGTTNEINPYVGTGGHEPYMFQIPTIAGEDYNWSFIYSGSEYDSWHATPFHAFVTNAYDLGMTTIGDVIEGDVIGIAEAFPFAGVENKPYSIDFTAKQSKETLVVQFGDANDGKEFWFKFANLKVSKYVYPLAYEEIDFVAQDDNKYTPLAYIESTGAVRENAFTTPYIAKASTEVDIKFHMYNPGNGDWRAIFCGRNGQGSGTGISLYKNGGADKFGYFVGGFTNDNFADFPGFDQDITVQASLSGLVVNGGEKVNTNQTSFASSTRGISMFANPEWDAPFRGRIYYMTIKEDGTTVYDFQPVMRHDGVFGYYDRKTATFVQPAQNNWNGYGFKKLDDKAYVTYEADTRIVIVGSTAQFLPDVQNLDGATFTWTSADESIATVAADGTVTGKKAGKVVITATTDADQGWTASYELTVSEPNYVRHDANNVGYAIVTGGNGWGDSPVANLVDKDARTKFGCSGAGDAWAIIIASEPVAVQQYSFVTGADTYNYPARNPRSWKLEGSNDNQTWTLIDEHNDFDAYKIHSVNRQEFEFPVNGTETFKFFKFSATSTGDGFQLGEFWINEQAHSWGEPVVTAATCTKAGTSVAECSDCHALKTEVLPIAAHNYKNGICETCSAKASEVVLLPNGQDNAYAIKFRHQAGVSDNEFEDIEAGWNTADFDDSNWDELMMPIGGIGYDGGARNGAKFNTIWFNEYNTYWFRRTFWIDNPSSITKLTVKALHDDDYAIFVNGTKVFARTGWTEGTNWEATEVDPSLLVAGQNVLAVYVEQNWGGAYCDFSLEAEAGAKVAVSDAKYATFVAPCDVDLAEGVKAYAVTDVAEGWVTLTEIADKAVPAGAAVVIEAEEGNYNLPKTTDVAALAQNELKAATAPVNVTEAKKQYVLADGTDGVGFYPVMVGTTIAAGKGYLEVTESGAKFYALGGEGTDVRGLIIENLDGTQTIYNLNGQKMEKAQKGVNIVNGHKFIVK